MGGVRATRHRDQRRDGLPAQPPGDVARGGDGRGVVLRAAGMSAIRPGRADRPGGHAVRRRVIFRHPVAKTDQREKRRSAEGWVLRINRACTHSSDISIDLAPTEMRSPAARDLAAFATAAGRRANLRLPDAWPTDGWGSPRAGHPSARMRQGYARVLMVGTTSARHHHRSAALLGTDPDTEDSRRPLRGQTTICDIEIVLGTGLPCGRRLMPGPRSSASLSRLRFNLLRARHIPACSVEVSRHFRAHGPAGPSELCP